MFEGSLIQGEDAAAHSEKQLYAQVAHGAGESLENIQICALGECSKTDAKGIWGFATEEAFAGGDVLFTVNGHGIDSAVVVNVPAGAKNVVIELENHGDEGVHAHSVVADGAEVTQHHHE